VWSSPSRRRAPRAAAALAAVALAAGPACAPLDPLRARADAPIEDLVAELAAIQPPRSAEAPASLERAARLVAEALEDAGWSARLQPFEVEREVFYNVSALLGSGSRPRLVIGAHYDVWADGPGADDNASGVAALVWVASRLAGRSLPVDVELVAYSLEEPPFFRTDDMGSARHAGALRDAKIPVVAMLSLEMLGYYSDAPGSQSFPDPSLEEQFGTTGNFLAVVGRPEEEPLLALLEPAMRSAGSLPVHALAMPPDLPGVGFSDHQSYWRTGFQAVMVTDTAFLRNPNYHQESDRPETLDFRRLEAAAAAVVAGAVALAEAAGPP
jgi:Zn-dependent M28 family amino/carboxypeptidase